MERITKMIAGKYKYPVTIRTEGNYHFLEGAIALKDEFKAMQGAKYLGFEKVNPQKVWRVNNVRRNNINIAYLEGLKPFERYTCPIDMNNPLLRRSRVNRRGETVPFYQHQVEMVAHILTRKQCIIAGEMGTGKTLAAIEAMELSFIPGIWYVGPKSAITSVRLECMLWQSKSAVHFMTYDELKKTLTNWNPQNPPPRFVVFDESSRLKNPTSQRSQAAFYLAESMRDHWGDKCYIVLMSGSPSPKTPLDWYWQCEIACPGFIKEGDINKFKRRLSISEVNNDMVGVTFSKHIAWKDGNPNRCGTCGRERKHEIHFMADVMKGEIHVPGNHDFTAMSNEVEYLYRRIAGLSIVRLKKDCMDLPEKIYRPIKLKPTIGMLNAAKLIMAKSATAMESMTLLRELSDGFQYKDTRTLTEVCTRCNGNKVLADGETSCDMCGGVGKKYTTVRETTELPSPKLDALNDVLDELEDIGRLVVYAGFTASIDRICAHIKKAGWEFIRVDGRGWYNSINPQWDSLQMLQEFQDKDSKYDNIVFVGHPGSAGMGLTLTASPAIVYYSNDFNAESRIQSEDRIHRAGMDASRGATIIDLLLLPTDEKVLTNLKRKRELQSISLGELSDCINEYQYVEG